MAYDKNNSGALFTNDRKQSDKSPDYQGNLNVDGVDYYLSGWKKKSQEGKSYLSLSVKAKDSKSVSAHSSAKADGYVKQRPAAKEETEDFLSDSIPF